jgi:nicotinamidase-related amidase
MKRTVARSTPYPWPYDGDLLPSRLALVVVLAGAGAEGADDGPPGPDPHVDPVLDRIALLAGATQEGGGVVVEVTTTPPSPAAGGPVLPRPGRIGLKGPGPVHRIQSAGIDGFFASSLDATLRSLGRDQLLLCGTWLETNVHSTMRSANDRGYECLLVLDACLAYDPLLTAASRSQIEMSGGIFGAVGETAAVLDALLPLPETPTERT